MIQDDKPDPTEIWRHCEHLIKITTSDGLYGYEYNQCELKSCAFPCIRCPCHDVKNLGKVKM